MRIQQNITKQMKEEQPFFQGHQSNNLTQIKKFIFNESSNSCFEKDSGFYINYEHLDGKLIKKIRNSKQVEDYLYEDPWIKNRYFLLLYTFQKLLEIGLPMGSGSQEPRYHISRLFNPDFIVQYQSLFRITKFQDFCFPQQQYHKVIHEQFNSPTKMRNLLSMLRNYEFDESLGALWAIFCLFENEKPSIINLYIKELFEISIISLQKNNSHLVAMNIVYVVSNLIKSNQKALETFVQINAAERILITAVNRFQKESHYSFNTICSINCNYLTILKTQQTSNPIFMSRNIKFFQTVERFKEIAINAPFIKVYKSRRKFD